MSPGVKSSTSSSFPRDEYLMLMFCGPWIAVQLHNKDQPFTFSSILIRCSEQACCQWHTHEFFFCVGGWGSTNSVEDSGQTERESGDSSPIVRGSAQFANGETHILIRL
jgi:hypothetical protein